MSFRLVPNSVSLDDLERRNSPHRRVISTNSVAFGADYVKVFEDTPVLSAAEVIDVKRAVNSVVWSAIITINSICSVFSLYSTWATYTNNKVCKLQKAGFNTQHA